jgi:hypothetical protein
MKPGSHSNPPGFRPYYSPSSQQTALYPLPQNEQRRTPKLGGPCTYLYGVTGGDGAPRGAKSSWAGYLSVYQTSGLSPSQPAFEVLGFFSVWGQGL